jgi:ribosomal protein S12 methylthiotransferase accessory factor
MRIFDREYAQPKVYAKGTHRSRGPEETLAAYAPLMPRLGITRLANVTGLDVVGLPVFMAIRPNARGLAVSQGKGWDAASAKASALMESIESWHGERVERPMRYESYRALLGSEPVADVNELPRKKGAVLRPDVPILFVEGFDLVEQRRIWVPMESVTTNFVLPSRAANTFFQSTNGLASGNHLLEAIVHALAEVIERDALAMCDLNQPDEASARQVDISTVEDIYCRQTIDLLASAGVGVAAWDVTSDVGIPAYAATIFESRPRPAWRPMGVFSGYGCHLAPGVALVRAISEAVQSRLTMISGSRDDMLHRDYRHCSNEDDRARFSAAVTASAPTLDARERRSLSTPTFEGDVAVLCEALARIGVTQIIVVDLTREEIGVPVVKVVVPGLEGFSMSNAHVPGRRVNAKSVRSR